MTYSKSEVFLANVAMIATGIFVCLVFYGMFFVHPSEPSDWFVISLRIVCVIMAVSLIILGWFYADKIVQEQNLQRQQKREGDKVELDQTERDTQSVG